MGRRTRRHRENPRHHNPEPPTPPDPGRAPLNRLKRHCHSLGVTYTDGYATGPGLLTQLEHPQAHLGSPERPGGKHPGRPHSNPTIRTDLLALAADIRWCILGLAYTAGWDGTGAGNALTALPNLLADADIDDIETTAHWLGTCISTARTALGYQQRGVHYPDAVCPHCEQHTIWCRPEETRGWCANDQCPGDPDTGGQPAWNALGLLALKPTRAA